MILMAFLVGFIATIPLNLERNVVPGSNLETLVPQALPPERCYSVPVEGFL
jgi:hypothetical protein